MKWHIVKKFQRESWRGKEVRRIYSGNEVQGGEVGWGAWAGAWFVREVKAYSRAAFLKLFSSGDHFH